MGTTGTDSPPDGRRRRSTERTPTGALPDPARPPGTHRISQIEHVVVVMMENHSYDNYLGALREHGDGLPTSVSNEACDGRRVRAHRLASTTQAPEIACQSWAATHDQWAGGTNSGFVRSAQQVARGMDDEEAAARIDDVMGYWDETQLPFYASLARTFALADRWFAPCLGPTFPNRRFLVAATAHGLTTDEPARCFDRPTNGTIFDVLSRHGISWANYHSSSPLHLVASRLLGRRGRHVATRLAPTARHRRGAVLYELESKLQFTVDVFAVSALDHLRHIHRMRRFFRDAAAGTLPAFCIVDPSFVDFSEEPPQDILLGERFAATVIDAVTRGPSWPSTLLVWCYDEHGGYYDHVPPPAAVEPDDVPPRTDDPEDRYDTYGFRVPAVIVSPYACPGTVIHDVFDHTSILRLIEDVWNLPSLTRRDAAATSIISALDLDSTPAFLRPPPLTPPALGYAVPPYRFAERPSP
jgi:phospholipase C